MVQIGTRGVTQAFNVAVGSILAHDAARGGRPFDGVDVERLFSAIQMLGNRDDIEVAPFVASWSDGLQHVTNQVRLPIFFQRNFRDALDSRSSTSALDRIFIDGVKAVTGGDSASVFRRLEVEMIDVLQTCLRVSPMKVDYLAPLLIPTEHEPIKIATLNYDLSIEILAERARMSVSTGIESWLGAFDWNWPTEAEVRLLKLHGSINWQYETQKDNSQTKLSYQQIELDDPEVNPGTRNSWNQNYALVFGQPGKLRGEGPFLAMLRAFDEFLIGTNELEIVGYSFRDDHINSVIRPWFNREDDPKITIIDPAFDVDFQRSDLGTFKEELRSVITEYNFNGAIVRPNHTIIQEYAQTALTRYLGPGPILDTAKPSRWSS